MIFRAKEKFGGGGPRLRLGNGGRRGERRGGPICIRNDERSGRWHSVWPRCGDIGHLLTPEATDPPRLVRFSLSPHDPLPPFSCPPNAERVFVTRIYPSLSLSLSISTPPCVSPSRCNWQAFPMDGRNMHGYELHSLYENIYIHLQKK